jgi:hypothetical protein
MNDQPEGAGNRRDYTGNGEDPQLNEDAGERFVPKTLLDYATLRVTDARRPTRSHPNFFTMYGSSPTERSFRRLHQVSFFFFSFTLKDRAKRWLNSLSRDSVGT